jgi:hypothetical protein
MKTYFFILFSFLCFASFAQVGVTTEPVAAIAPSANAELDVVSQNNNTGVIIPIFADVDITNNAAGVIPNPANGLLIYNTDKKKFMYNAGIPSAPIWTFVGCVPAIADYAAAGTAPATYANLSTYVTPIEGEVVYDINTKLIWYYSGGLGWKHLQ